MKLKCFIAALVFTAALACNNDAAVQDKTDSVSNKNDADHSNFPQAGDMTGNDSIHSPETHSDSSNLKSH